MRCPCCGNEVIGNELKCRYCGYDLSYLNSRARKAASQRLRQEEIYTSENQYTRMRNNTYQKAVGSGEIYCYSNMEEPRKAMRGYSKQTELNSGGLERKLPTEEPVTRTDIRVLYVILGAIGAMQLLQFFLLLLFMMN